MGEWDWPLDCLFMYFWFSHTNWMSFVFCKVGWCVQMLDLDVF